MYAQLGLEFGDCLLTFTRATSLVEMHVVALRSALVAGADGSELKRSWAIGDSFRALHLKLTPT